MAVEMSVQECGCTDVASLQIDTQGAVPTVADWPLQTVGCSLDCLRGGCFYPAVFCGGSDGDAQPPYAHEDVCVWLLAWPDVAVLVLFQIALLQMWSLPSALPITTGQQNKTCSTHTARCMCCMYGNAESTQQHCNSTLLRIAARSLRHGCCGIQHGRRSKPPALACTTLRFPLPSCLLCCCHVLPPLCCSCWCCCGRPAALPRRLQLVW